MVLNFQEIHWKHNPMDAKTVQEKLKARRDDNETYLKSLKVNCLIKLN